MNNLAFNTVAEELKTSLFAQNPGGSLNALQLDGEDNLLVAGTVTVSAPVTIANTSLTVTGTVTVSEITAPVTIANTSLTVAGTVTVSEITAPVTIANTSLTVAGTVTVSEITAPVTIANATLTTTVAGYNFVTDVEPHNGATGTGVAFADTNISQMKTGTFFVYNSGTSALTVSLQISPTTASAFYIDDPSYTNVSIPASENQLFVIGKFANYARLNYDAGTGATFSVYYNAQS